jgi:hypothetical protein
MKLSLSITPALAISTLVAGTGIQATSSADTPAYFNVNSSQTAFNLNSHDSAESGAKSLCPQAEPVKLSKNLGLKESLDKLYRGEAFRLRAYESLGGVVRVP